MPSSLACAEQSRGARRKPPVLILLRETKLVRLWCAKKPPWLEGLVPHHRLRRGPHPRLSLLHRVTAVPGSGVQSGPLPRLWELRAHVLAAERAPAPGRSVVTARPGRALGAPAC